MEKADAVRRLVFSLQASQAKRRPGAKAGVRGAGSAREPQPPSAHAADVPASPEVSALLLCSCFATDLFLYLYPIPY